VLTGILFVLKTGIPWEDLPQEMSCGSGMTCWRRASGLERCWCLGTAAPGAAGRLPGARICASRA